MSKKLVLASIFTVAASAAFAGTFSGNVSSQVGLKPQTNQTSNFDNPNSLNVNYQEGNWTYSLNGTTEFTGMLNSANTSSGNQNTMLNTWGGTVGYNFQNGLTSSMNVSYLNFRAQSSSETKGLYPVLVTGYQLAPTVTYKTGNVTYNVPVQYQVVGSSNSNAAVTSSAGITNGSTPWNGLNGEYFSIFPTVSVKASSDLTVSSGVQFQQANTNYIILTQAVDNENGNCITIHPMTLSYNVAAVSGLSLTFDSLYYIYNTPKNDAVQSSIQNLPGANRIGVYPGLSYSVALTPALTWSSTAQVYGKWYTNNVNGQKSVTGTTSYGAQVYTGLSYAF